MAMSDLILAEHKSTLPPGVQEDLDNISVAARHMEMLVQDVSELESLHGGVTITPRDTDISGLLRDVSNQCVVFLFRCLCRMVAVLVCWVQGAESSALLLIHAWESSTGTNTRFMMTSASQYSLHGACHDR